MLYYMKTILIPIKLQTGTSQRHYCCFRRYLVADAWRREQRLPVFLMNPHGATLNTFHHFTGATQLIGDRIMNKWDLYEYEYAWWRFNFHKIQHLLSRDRTQKGPERLQNMIIECVKGAVSPPGRWTGGGIGRLDGWTPLLLSASSTSVKTQQHPHTNKGSALEEEPLGCKAASGTTGTCSISWSPAVMSHDHRVMKTETRCG